MEEPLVSVVCLSFNHEKFVGEALASVQAQTYRRVELVVVDDASSDRSAEIIRQWTNKQPISFLALDQNIGNCAAFNRGLAQAKGDFIIDLAADDILMHDRIEEGVRAFQVHGPDFGVNFTDARLIDRDGLPLGLHSDRFPHATIPQGDIYGELVSRYFISSPTMMIRKTVFERLGGYDETLAYEDFDFWIRSSREFKYCYTPRPLVKKRILPDSLSSKQYRRRSAQLVSTYRVCEKIKLLNRTAAERIMLKKRIRFEMRKALELGEARLALRYWRLLRSV